MDPDIRCEVCGGPSIIIYPVISSYFDRPIGGYYIGLGKRVCLDCNSNADYYSFPAQHFTRYMVMCKENTPIMHTYGSDNTPKQIEYIERNGIRYVIKECNGNIQIQSFALIFPFTNLNDKRYYFESDTHLKPANNK